MSTQTLHTDVFGRSVSFNYSDTWVGYSILSLRVVMAYVFLSSGLEKLADPTWSAEGFLLNAVPDGNPLGSLWPELAGAPLVDQLVIWGQVLIGLALLLGLALRFAALMGALMMVMFWAAALEGGLLAGLPVAHGFVVSYHVVYGLILFGLGAFGAGRILGLDARLEAHPIVENNGWLRLFLG